MVAPHWDFKDGTAPATPASGYGRLYVKNDGTFHFINDSGTDTELGAGGGGGGGAGMMLWDEGVPKATGTIINIVGDRLVGSISGTVIQILSSPDPAELIGIMGWNDGIPLGTGTIIDFGNNLTPTLSGTVIRLDATAGGGASGLGIMFWDEGIPKGTGTILNVVGDGLTLTLSGTVADLTFALPAHASTHQDGGSDAIKLDDLATPDDNTDLDATDSLHGLMSKTDKGKLDGIAAGADVTGDNAPQAHAASHENGGGDEISVAGLSGELADNQPPLAHASDHTDGTDDIQDATSGQKGLMTAAYATKLDGIAAGAQVNAAELIGIYGQNEGTGLGTGTMLNVFGGGATLGLSGTILGLDLTEAAKFGFSILVGDGSGTFPVGTQVAPVEIPFAGVFDDWTLLADVTGSITVNVWKDTYGNFPPTSADVIFSPSLTNQRKNTSALTQVVAEGDVLQLYLGPATNIKQLTLSIRGHKS